MWHQCNLAAKESGLECACVSNENFTALVSGSHRCHGLQRNCIKFCIKLEHSSAETSERIQKDTARGNWWLAASPWQHSHSCITSHTEFFGKTSNHPGDSAPLQPRFGTLWLLPSPKTKIIFKWKRFYTVNEIQENTMGLLMVIGRTVWGPKVPTLRGTEVSLSYVQCFLYLVSSSVNVSVMWPDTFWTD